MRPSSIYLIEDSVSYRIYLKNVLTRYQEQNNLTFDYTVQPILNYVRFYEHLDDQVINNNDIFIIDIYLNTYFTGIDFGKKLRKINQSCKIIYLTSATDKSLIAINQRTYPSAYLIKSDDPEVIQIKLINLIPSLFFEEHKTDETLTLQSNNTNFVINVSDILYISVLKGYRNKINILTTDSKLIVDGRLSSIKSQLSSPPFYLDLKSFIINYNKIESISASNQRIIFKNGFELQLNQKLIYKLLRFQKGLK